MEPVQLDIFKIMWQSGIVVKLVLAMLIFASIFSWAVIFKKRKMLKKMKKNNHLFMEVYYQSANLKEVMLRSETIGFSSFHTLFISGYNELIKIKGEFETPKHKTVMRKHFSEFGLGALERALSKGANDVNNKMDYLLSILASIGSVTPFIGLFGTVWGIIDSFTGLAGGGSTLEAVAPGIAEALVATAMGLAAAIPAVWFYNYYLSENSKINVNMESFEQEFINTVERSLLIRGID